MTLPAARRYRGLAQPALLLFTLVMPLALLAGCRQQGEWFQLEGTALGTGYHITLNGDLKGGELALIEAAIQGELASLERSAQALGHLGAVPYLLAPAASGLDAAGQLFREHWQALAVDRLCEVLDDFSIVNAMVELGGVLRTQGVAEGRHPWRVRLPYTALGETPDPVLRLENAALVSRTTPRPSRQSGERAEEHILAVSAVAPSAVAADRLARTLLDAGPNARAMERPARFVVLTPRGIESFIGSALEPLLER